MIGKRFAAALVPVAALAFAFSPAVASADTGGPVMVISPGVNVISGVEVAGVNTSGTVLSCVFTDNGSSVQTCELPAGNAAPAPAASTVEVAGVQAGPSTAAIGPSGSLFMCVFNASAIGPQTCAINA